MNASPESTPTLVQVEAFLRTWQTVMRAKTFDAARYEEPIPDADFEAARVMLAQVGMRRAYAVIRAIGERIGVWRHARTIRELVRNVAAIDCEGGAA